MNKAIKEILKYGGIIFLLGMIIFVSNELFIRDWRIERSEKRVQKSIKSNFQDKKEEFKNFKEFIHKLNINPVTEIEFLGRNKISAELSSHSMTDSIFNNSAPFYFSSDDDELEIDVKFELNQNGTATVNYLDTIFETHNWSWNFKGDKKNKDFKKFIEYAGISEKDFETLRNKIKELDCEAIWIHKDKSVSIRYDGFSMYQYEYYLSSEKGEYPTNYEKLDEEIYAGLYDNGLFCGWIIFDK